jgi:hypothetical protein
LAAAADDDGEEEDEGELDIEALRADEGDRRQIED